MTFETWIAFAAASAVLLIIPGPTILLVVSYALGQGWRTALPMSVGVALGDFTAMTASMLGLGVLMSTSAAGLHGVHGMAAYSSSKAALIGLICVFVPLHYLYRALSYGSPFPMLFLRWATWVVGARVVRHGVELTDKGEAAWTRS